MRWGVDVTTQVGCACGEQGEGGCAGRGSGGNTLELTECNSRCLKRQCEEQKMETNVAELATRRVGDSALLVCVGILCDAPASLC